MRLFLSGGPSSLLTERLKVEQLMQSQRCEIDWRDLFLFWLLA
jgi:hypothetical protein